MGIVCDSNRQHKLSRTKNSESYQSYLNILNASTIIGLDVWRSETEATKQLSEASVSSMIHECFLQENFVYSPQCLCQLRQELPEIVQKICQHPVAQKLTLALFYGQELKIIGIMFSSQSDYPTASPGLSSPWRCGSRSRGSLRPESCRLRRGEPARKMIQVIFPIGETKAEEFQSSKNLFLQRFNFWIQHRIHAVRVALEKLFSKPYFSGLRAKIPNPLRLVSDANFSGLHWNPKPLSSRPSAARFGSAPGGERSGELAWCLEMVDGSSHETHENCQEVRCRLGKIGIHSFCACSNFVWKFQS